MLMSVVEVGSWVLVAAELVSCDAVVGCWCVGAAVGLWLFLAAADEGCWILSEALGLVLRPVEDGS